MPIKNQGYDKQTNKQINHKNKFKRRKYDKYKKDKRINKHSGKSRV